MLCYHEDKECPYKCFDSDSSYEFECFAKPKDVPCPYTTEEEVIDND